MVRIIPRRVHIEQKQTKVQEVRKRGITVTEDKQTEERDTVRRRNNQQRGRRRGSCGKKGVEDKAHYEAKAREEEDAVGQRANGITKRDLQRIDSRLVALGNSGSMGNGVRKSLGLN